MYNFTMYYKGKCITDFPIYNLEDKGEILEAIMKTFNVIVSLTDISAIDKIQTLAVLTDHFADELTYNVGDELNLDYNLNTEVGIIVNLEERLI